VSGTGARIIVAGVFWIPVFLAPCFGHEVHGAAGPRGGRPPITTETSGWEAYWAWLANGQVGGKDQQPQGPGGTTTVPQQGVAVGGP